MNTKKATIILSILCVAFLAVAVWLFLLQDRQAPVITIDDSIKPVYTEGVTNETLLEGVTAKDDRDGNLTDKVFINELRETEDGRMQVMYAVMDSSNHVSIAYRIVEMAQSN